jgi:LPPG:FO 2-phospho-L-lactate transferase
VRERRGDVVAISPIINGAALKGPADRLMREFGYDVSCEGVATFYDGLIGSIIIDETDRAFESAIRSRGLDVRVTTTVMADPSHASQLAKAALA